MPRLLRPILVLAAVAATLACNFVLGMEEKSLDESRICSADGARCASSSGCSDGVRDAFDRATFPTIAGCLAAWRPGAMNAPPTGTACGNGNRVECPTPADACAPGWHVCGTLGSDEVRNTLTRQDCAEAPASFVMALGATTCGCESQPVACCGKTCVSVRDGNCLYPGEGTKTMGRVGGFDNVCSSTKSPSETGFGVLCCFTK